MTALEMKNGGMSLIEYNPLYDEEAFLASLDRKTIIDNLTLYDVERFIRSLGVTEIQVDEKKGELICPTICHNRLEDATSMKLYYYQNSKLFRCYTECDDNMSIFELYRKYMALNSHPISLEEAEAYIKQFLGKSLIAAPAIHSSKNSFDTTKYSFERVILKLDEYPSEVLSCFVHYPHPLWLQEGITEDVMRQFNILFSIKQNKIVIPHYDSAGRLVGIRARALEEEDIAMGKYMPIMVNGVIYTHKLHFNLYGLYQNKAAIKKYHKAVIFEAEKSSLKDKVFYGEDSVAVAICGSSLNKYQVSLLTNVMGVSEIVLALDKEYEEWNSPQGIKYKNKLLNMCKKYKNYANFSYIFDDKGLIGLKDSPNDRGQEVWEELYRRRFKVR